MRGILLMVAFLAGCKAGDGEGAKEEGGRTEQAPETPSLNHAALTLAALYHGGGEMKQVPYTLSVSGTMFAQGETGVAMMVGSGTFEAQIGPLVEQSDPEHPYYPNEMDGYTDDGLPMVIKDDRRYLALPVSVTIDAVNTRVDVVMTSVLGNAHYNCERRIYAYDPSEDDRTGYRYWSGTASRQRINFVDGRQIVPLDPNSFGGALSPGDALVIGDDGMSLELETDTANSIEPLWDVGWRKGTGLNDFGFIYFDMGDDPDELDGHEKVTEVGCEYDWSNFRGELEPAE